MKSIKAAGLNDLPVIHYLAHAIWHYACGDILSPGQLKYMIDKIYSLRSLQNQLLNPEFDTFITLRPLKPSISGGRSLNLEKVVGRKPFGNMAGSYYFWGLWHFYVRR